jgi:UDP-GlcNAc:undecaprenyl-phosphate GlcNAc-1-phosphate transferase
VPAAIVPELAFAASCAAALALTPLAIRVARRTGFYDRPAGYKAHARPTPYLGGAAVVAATLLGATVFPQRLGSLGAIAALAAALWALGTLDDRRGLAPGTRLAVEALAGAGLYAAGVGWPAFGSEVANLLLTVVFTVGVVNACNLMDNSDGACAGTAGAAAVVLGLAAAIGGDPALAALAFALAGACAGFLPYNLASPSRVFLGDGGSMPVGLLLAAVIMSLPGAGALGFALLPVAVVLAGLPAFDTALVIVSRRRRGVTVLLGGNDHLAHRLRARLGSARRAAGALAAAQALLVGAGAALASLAAPAAAVGSIALIGAGVVAIVLLEHPEWLPVPVAGEQSA